MAQKISLVNQKGGVGKTTSAINIAVNLAILEEKTLLIDLDPQANASTGVSDLYEKQENSVYDVLIKKVPIKNSIIKTQIEHFDVLPSSSDLVGAEIELVSMIAREYQLQKILNEIDQEYKYVIIDCPPSLGLLTLNALAASNSLIIPIQCEYYALEGLGQLLNTVRLVQKHINSNVKINGVLLTMFDSRLNLSKEVSNEVKGYFKDKLFNTVINRNVRLSEAPSFGKPAIMYDANSTGAKNYMHLVEEIINRGK